jgi:adenylate cyclase
MLKKILLNPWTALITLAVILAVRIADPSFVESVRLRYFDTLITSKAPTENNIYTVNIDEATLDKYGQWPLPRDRYAKLIKELYKRGAGLVVFNVLMAEPDRMGKDANLARVIDQYPIVLPNVPSQKTKNNPQPPGSAVLGPEYLDRIITYPGMIANIAILEEMADGIGTVNTLPEIDGVNRRIPLIAAIDGQLYPSLSIEALRVLAQDTTFQVKLNENGVEKMRIPKFGPISTDNLGRIWIDWSQRNKTVSAVDLPRDFGGAVVIVGVTAAGIGNPVPTPNGAVWPSDVQASVLATMINGVVIQRPDWADGAEILTLAVLGVILLFLTRWTYVGIGFGIFSIAGCVAGSHLLYVQNLWLGDCTILCGGLIGVMLHAYSVKFVSEFLQKQQIKKQFGSYVNPTIVERLQQHPELIRLGGEKRELSVVMTDMRNFTALGESYGEAGVEDFTQVMNSYMTALSVPILKNDGTLIKFIGDASLHIHGAPIEDADHARRAVQTALEMIEAVKGFNEELAALGKPPVGMGAGVNTGEIVVGNIGAKTKFGYDVLGDAVSLAARLESQTKGYGVLMIISENTARQLQGAFPLWELDNIAVKGKTEPVRIFAIEQSTTEHEEFLKLYYAGDWKKAITLIPKCVNANPKMEKYYECIMERLAAGKPAAWDGTFRATSK